MAVPGEIRTPGLFAVGGTCGEPGSVVLLHPTSTKQGRLVRAPPPGSPQTPDPGSPQEPDAPPGSVVLPRPTSTKEGCLVRVSIPLVV